MHNYKDKTCSHLDGETLKKMRRELKEYEASWVYQQHIDEITALKTEVAALRAENAALKQADTSGAGGASPSGSLGRDAPGPSGGTKRPREPDDASVCGDHSDSE